MNVLPEARRPHATASPCWCVRPRIERWAAGCEVPLDALTSQAMFQLPLENSPTLTSKFRVEHFYQGGEPGSRLHKHQEGCFTGMARRMHRQGTGSAQAAAPRRQHMKSSQACFVHSEAGGSTFPRGTGDRARSASVTQPFTAALTNPGQIRERSRCALALHSSSLGYATRGSTSHGTEQGRGEAVAVDRQLPLNGKYMPQWVAKLRSTPESEQGPQPSAGSSGPAHARPAARRADTLSRT